MIVLVIVISVISGWDDFDTKEKLKVEREEKNASTKTYLKGLSKKKLQLEN